MKLSIVIVNYNVKHFLEQCLHSVRRAVKNIENEVFVVDNNSVDGSCAMVKAKFQEVILIENKTNTGFSVANNQAIRKSQGEYVLLLNPDTVVEETTFERIIEFMDKHPKAGGLGVKMIDGNGTFLPESKRALPTPSVSFYKIFGLSRLFPKSKIFAKYHLGYLDNNQIHKVEILSGAFMFMRKKTLDEVGLLDEQFFMYGEDIDLSYRIIKGGYENYYFPETTIIHYKGESTKKGSINYVLVFYNAMIIFAKKHFSQKNADIFSFFIKLAIYFRASLSLLKRFVSAIILPLLDSLLIFLGFFYIKPYWEQIKFNGNGEYPPAFLNIIVPIYITIWLLSVFFAGGYYRPVSLKKHSRGLAIGTVIILIFYGLLSEDYRFSRMLILLGAVWAFVSSITLRYLFSMLNLKGFSLKNHKPKRIIIIGNKAEAQRVLNVLQQTDIKSEFAGFVSHNPNNTTGFYIGNISQLNEIIKINKVDELIFCAKDISSQEIINKMLELSELNIDYKIAPPESLSIIGSNSIDTAGELYVVDLNSIAKKLNHRNKRLFDIVVSILLLLFFFVTFPINAKKLSQFIKNIFSVLVGKKSWVGYHTSNNTVNDLPTIKPGILSPIYLKNKRNLTNQQIEKLNTIYAKNYKISTDFGIILKGFKELGEKK